MFTTEDFRQFEEKGISPETVDAQIKNFRKGFDFVNLESAATPDHGLISPTQEQAQSWVDNYEQHSAAIETLKFVPASGIAILKIIGLWPSGLRRLLWEQEIVGSNPAAPTTHNPKK